uniref:Olfactory receptor n=1 Tax=Chrysemys picta bellii TaxID=8478 RepID=A0A8C3HT75_CHRPI
MEKHNQSTLMEFILLGFPGSQYLQISLFVLFLFMYILTVLGNVAIITLVVTHRRLHTPMYCFICNLSFLEIWYTTVCVPKALEIFLGKSKTISFTGCLLQMYFMFSLGCTEYFLLSIMAYDRYLAICYPLHYSTIMNSALSAQLTLGSWVCGFLVISMLASLIYRLSFCGPNVINNFFCEIDSWIVLSCTDISIIEVSAFIISVIQRAFSTCSSHLAVVLLWYGSTIFLFVKPSARNSLELTKIVNILNTVVTPLLNPFIYALRNREVKEAMQNILFGL